MTQNGELTQAFQLVDATGNYVSCLGHARHADSENIEDGSEIIVYFASAQPGLSGNPGSSWLYSEAHVVFLRKNAFLPQARFHMELRGK